MSTASLTPAQKVVDYVALTTSALDKALQNEQVKESQDKRAAELIPSVVKSLVENGRIEAHQAEKAAEVLKDPVTVLELLAKVAKHRNADELTLGTGTLQGGGQKKEASLGPVVGARRSGVQDKDVAFYAALGLNPPIKE